MGKKEGNKERIESKRKKKKRRNGYRKQQKKFSSRLQ